MRGEQLSFDFEGWLDLSIFLQDFKPTDEDKAPPKYVQAGDNLLYWRQLSSYGYVSMMQYRKYGAWFVWLSLTGDALLRTHYPVYKYSVEQRAITHMEWKLSLSQDVREWMKKGTQ